MQKNCRVVPAILTDDPQALKAMVRQSESFTDYVQLDIMDGQFVPSRSISWEHIASLSISLRWEAHLMVEHPEKYLKGFKEAGAKKLIFHYEATATPREVISLTRKLGLGVGLAVNPETPNSAISPLVGEVDSVLFLSVHPGFYGSKFIPEVLDKIAAFNNAHSGVEVGIDGGIKENNITQIARYGINTIYVGSAIFLQPNPGGSFRKLLTLAQEGCRQSARGK